MGRAALGEMKLPVRRRRDRLKFDRARRGVTTASVRLAVLYVARSSSPRSPVRRFCVKTSNGNAQRLDTLLNLPAPRLRQRRRGELRPAAGLHKRGWAGDGRGRSESVTVIGLKHPRPLDVPFHPSICP